MKKTTLPPIIISAIEGYEVYATKSDRIAIVQSGKTTLIVTPSQAEALAPAISSIAKSTQQS